MPHVMTGTAFIDLNAVFMLELVIKDSHAVIGIKRHPEYSLRFPEALVEKSKLYGLEYAGAQLQWQEEASQYYYAAHFNCLPGNTTLLVKSGRNICHRFQWNEQQINVASFLQLPVEVVRKIADDPGYVIPFINQSTYNHALEMSSLPDTPHISTHTHLSADDPKEALLDLALCKNFFIPRRFLDKMKVPYTALRQPIPWEYRPTLYFGPKFHAQQHLPPQEEAVAIREVYRIFCDAGKGETFKRAVLRHFSIPVDEIRQQGGFEDIFMLLEFITKVEDRETIRERILNIAINRRDTQNCRYMQLASGSVLKPAFILGWQDAVKELAGIQLELKLGIPRHLRPEQMMDLMDKAIAYHEAGVCCGIDIMGFEDNKTSKFASALEYLGRKLNEKGIAGTFVVQVHAGETSKNPQNVNDVLSYAERCGFAVTIGHSLNGWNGATLTLMKKLALKGQVTIQLLHGSNISLSALNRLEDVPYQILADNKIPCLVDTDGAIYQTNYRNLLVSLVFAGADANVLDKIARAQKEYYLARQPFIAARHFLAEGQIQAIEEKLSQHSHFTPLIQKKYQRAEEKKLRKILDLLYENHIRLTHEAARRLIQDKAHIMLFGASGKSWSTAPDALHNTGLSLPARQEIILLAHIMAAMLDPAKVTFGIGRAKKSGGAAEALIEALDRSEKDFSVIVYAVRKEDLSPESPLFKASCIKAVYNLGGGLLDLACHIASLAALPGRVLMLLGGQRSTADIAREALRNPDAKNNLLLMRGEGASGVYADRLPPALSFGVSCPAEEAMHALYSRMPRIFLPCFQHNMLQEVKRIRTALQAGLGIEGISWLQK